MCCSVSASRSCGSCSRHSSTLAYLIIVVLSTVLAGVLKYAVAPALVVVASDPESSTGAMLAPSNATANLFYAVADCVARVDAWDYAYFGGVNNI